MASADSPTDGKEYVTILGPGQSTPAPWINVIANPTFGFQAATEGGGYTWSAQQPREPAHALVERSRQRSAGRSVLFARRRDRRCLEPDRAADPQRLGDLHRSSRPGLQPLRAHRAWDRRGSSPIRAVGGIDQDLAPDVDATRRARPGVSQHYRLCRMGAWASRSGLAPALSKPRSMPATGAMFARNPWNIGVRLAHRFRRLARRAARLDRRSARVHRPQRLAGEPGGAGGRRAPVQRRRRRVGRLRGDAHEARIGARRRCRNRVLSGRRALPRGGEVLDPEVSRRRSRRARGGRRALLG